MSVRVCVSEGVPDGICEKKPYNVFVQMEKTILNKDPVNVLL